MTAKKNDIFELRFEGNNIKPNKVKPSEVANLIQDFEKALLSVIKQDYPQIDGNELLVTFEKIEDKSLGLAFVSNNEIEPAFKRMVSTSYKSLNTAISTNNFSRYGNETIAPVRNISDFTKRHQCNGSFKYNGKNLSVITPSTEITFVKTQYLKGNTTIYGELIDAGGDNPNIHIKISDTYSVIIKTDKEKTKELASRLYDQVGLKGEAKWDIFSSKIIDFKLYEVLDYTSGNIKSAIEELRKETSGVWDSYNSNESINKKLLR
jgi:hypothetical protein